MDARVDTEEGLTSLFHAPNERAVRKQLDRLNPQMVAFVEHVSFLVLATSDGAGCVDASPRGGPPGFVRCLDDRHLAIPDLAGNNRLDSYRNVIRHPHAGLLLMVPGRDETLRVNGPAALTDDAGILNGFTKDLRTPKLALVVETEEVFGHCAKAFRRGMVWQPDAWVPGAPDLAAMYACEWDLDPSSLRSGMDERIAADLAHD